MPESLFKKVRFLADFLFPNLCFGCGISGTLLCAACQERIPLFWAQRCLLCRKNPVRYGEPCFECLASRKTPVALDAVFAATCYHIPVVKKMIHAFKYRFVVSFAEPLGKILVRAVEQSGLPLPTFVIPVPLHKKRLRFRGFNQSELLSQALVSSLAPLEGISSEPLLTRIRANKPQQKTKSKEERSLNLRAAFQVREGANFKDAVVWLVDDVVTTNSTLSECAQILKAAGAKKVYGVVLAAD